MEGCTRRLMLICTLWIKSQILMSKYLLGLSHWCSKYLQIQMLQKERVKTWNHSMSQGRQDLGSDASADSGRSAFHTTFCCRYVCPSAYLQQYNLHYDTRHTSSPNSQAPCRWSLQRKNIVRHDVKGNGLCMIHALQWNSQRTAVSAYWYIEIGCSECHTREDLSYT